VTSVSSSDRRVDATCKQASSAPHVTCPLSADKEGVRGKPGIPNSRSPRTIASKGPGVGGTSPAMTSRGELESGRPEAPTRAVSLEDKGVGGSGRVMEWRKFRTPKVCFLFRKNPSKWSGTKSDRPQRSPPSTYTYRADDDRQPLVRAFFGGGLDSPRDSWPRRPMTLEPTRHLPPPRT
jgi:hypothetical protein